MSAPPTVEDLWREYAPISERDNDSWPTERGRAAHLVRILGARKAGLLSLADVEFYRGVRFKEKTVRGTPPAPATIDREVELLKRVVAFGRRCRRIAANPLAGIPLMNKPNIRTSVFSPEKFDVLHANLPEPQATIAVLAYDTGMRLGEMLHLRWDMLDWEAGVVRLSAHDTKTNQARNIFLTRRAAGALAGLPRHGPMVFTNPKTEKGFRDIRESFKTAAAAAGMPDAWFHDLRRSFIVRARRAGIAEKVVMRMSGHKSRSVFDRYNVVEDSDVERAARSLD